jgi:anhydro-N-acetylmuramic acid kinase
MQSFKAIGLMSGTSLDGVDLAACEFTLENGRWSYLIRAAHTFPYPEEWSVRLSGLPSGDAVTLARTHVEYGHFLGQLAKSFISSTGFTPLLIASHGHTIFHQPENGFTCQIGSGSAIAAETGLPVASDFRSLDVALGGQGAPLVPVGDRLLFGEYQACLNLGGFANVSMESHEGRIAFDICPVNIVLNHLAGKLGLAYDRDGENARKGKVHQDLLEELNQLDYYGQSYPKSLGREWVESCLYPVLIRGKINTVDLLRTYSEHAAFQVTRAMEIAEVRKILVTGGGARNCFLIERFRHYSRNEFHLPDNSLIDFKEALVFAFLGVLRYKGDSNVLKSVTGCSRDHSGGMIFNI